MKTWTSYLNLKFERHYWQCLHCWRRRETLVTSLTTGLQPLHGVWTWTWQWSFSEGLWLREKEYHAPFIQANTHVLFASVQVNRNQDSTMSKP
jgi:hypothetical protein